MHKMNLPENIIQQSLSTLPHLKRWRLPVQEHLG